MLIDELHDARERAPAAGIAVVQRGSPEWERRVDEDLQRRRQEAEATLVEMR